MDYEFWFWMFVSFLFGVKTSKGPIIYIGSNKEKYDSAFIGILLR